MAMLRGVGADQRMLLKLPSEKEAVTWYAV